ncbi:uncharacterized protein LOC144618183 isoform X2 [Crassostrea virginica]
MAKRSANWSSEEEVVLVEEIGKREGILFGKMKGDGCIKIGEIRNRGWQEVADVLNARFSSQKREAQDVKKKYYNIKQRSKEKLDQIKRPKTGGGKPVQLTSAEDLFLLGMEGRPQIEGLPFGVDTDATSGNVERAAVEVPVQSTSSGNPTTSGLRANSATTSKKEKFGANNRKRLAHLEEENLKLDNERLRLEINQLKNNKEIFNLQKEILVLKKQKLEFEIQANYPYFTEAMSSRSHFSNVSEY